MRVIVAVKGQPGGSATSRVTRYIAERDRDEQREGSEPRRLFSDKEDGLSYRQADRLLAGPWTPQKDELLHLAVSFRDGDFTALGADESGRQQRLKEAAREAMKDMAEALGAKRLIWVAGIHRNTQHPHLHLVIQRAYVRRETNDLQRVQRLPRELLPGREKDAGGAERVRPGGISQSFENALDRAIERARLEAVARGESKGVTAPADAPRGGFDDRKERLILGRAMVAEDRIEQLVKKRDEVEKYGELRRYEVTDERGRKRMLSVADLRRQAEAKADRILWRDSPQAGRAKFNPEERRQVRQALIERELASQAALLAGIGRAHSTTLHQINFRLVETEKSATAPLAAAGAVKVRYQEMGKELPLPVIARADLSRMQEQAIAGGRVDKVRELEAIRLALAAENHAPARTPQEAGRLAARLLLAQSELTLAQARAARFAETKHWQRWVVGERGARGYSLAEVERAIAWESDQARFIGRARINWNDGKREQAAERARELGTYRESILARIETERARVEVEVKEKAEMVATLFGIEAAERKRQHAQGQELSPPLLNKYELALLDGQAQQRRDPAFHRLVAHLEGEADVRSAGVPGLSVTERVARARAREIIAGIDVRSSHSRLENFNERRNSLDVIVSDDGTRELRVKRLADVGPKNEVAEPLRPWLTRRAEFREVAAAVDAHGSRMTEEYERTMQSRDVLAELARQSERDFRLTHPGQDLPLPQFTPRELATLELQAARERDPALRERYERLYQDALSQGRDPNDREASENKMPSAVRNSLETVPDLVNRWREGGEPVRLEIDEGMDHLRDDRLRELRDDLFSR